MKRSIRQWMAWGLALLMCVQLAGGALAYAPDPEDPLMANVVKTVLDFESITTGVRLGVDETAICPSSTAPAAITNGNVVLQTATGSSLDGGTWLKYTVNGPSANVPLRMDKMGASATTDWSGASGYMFYLDTTELSGTDTVAISIPFSENTTYEYWVPVAGGTVYIESAGHTWQPVALTGNSNMTGVAAEGNQMKVGELVLNAGYKGWVKVPLNTDTYQSLRSVKNNVMDLNVWLYFQPYVEVETTGYGKSVYFDQFMIYKESKTVGKLTKLKSGADFEGIDASVALGTATGTDAYTNAVTAVKNGTMAACTATGSSLDSGTWLKYTIKGTTEVLPLKMDQMPNATTDWAGADAFTVYVDTTEMKDKVDKVAVSMVFSETAAGNYEYWVPVVGATVFIEDGKGGWTPKELTQSTGVAAIATANPAKAGELLLDAGYKGNVLFFLKNDTYQPLRSVQNGTMDLGTWRFLQPYASVGADGYNNSVYFDAVTLYTETVADTLTVAGSFGSDMILQQNEDVVITGTADAGVSVTVTLTKNSDGQVKSTAEVTADEKGNWKATLAGQAGGYDTYTLTVATSYKTRAFSNVVFGEVWMSGGQSNMYWLVKDTAEAADWQAASRHDAIRVYFQETAQSTTELTSAQGMWATAGTWNVVQNCSAVAYAFAENLLAKLDMPVGIIQSAVKGTTITTWIGGDALKAHSDYQSYIAGQGYTYTEGQGRGAISAYFNSRIAPFRDFHVAGVIWYQGESDRFTGRDVLEKGLPILWESWSDVLDNDELPFFSVQLAAYYENSGSYAKVSESNFAMEAAMKVIGEKNGGKTGAIALYDVEVDTANVHPTHKKVVGDRLATAAWGKVYADEPMLCGSPVLTSVKQVNDTVVLTFDADTVGNGLKLLKGEAVAGFTVKKDTSYVAVPATITSTNTITVSLADAAGSTGLYYAYADGMLTANVGNGIDFPVMPIAIQKLGVVWGGANDDGKVNTLDVRAILRHVTNKAILSAEAQARVDVTGDGAVTIMDARKALRFVVGKVTSLAPEDN